MASEMSVEQRVDLAIWMAEEDAKRAERELLSAMSDLERRVKTVRGMMDDRPESAWSAVNGIGSYAASVENAADKVKQARNRVRDLKQLAGK